jgi:multicomponent Na+:H+ antiporter subunit A
MLFVFWELTSITSFLLIGFEHAEEASRRAAIQALVVTGGGGLALLAGLLVIWNITGVSEISLLLNRRPLRASPFYLLALVAGAGRGLSPNRRSSRSISGCPTPWKRRRRSRPICIPPPW